MLVRISRYKDRCYKKDCMRLRPMQVVFNYRLTNGTFGFETDRKKIEHAYSKSGFPYKERIELRKLCTDFPLYRPRVKTQC